MVKLSILNLWSSPMRVLYPPPRSPRLATPIAAHRNALGLRGVLYVEMYLRVDVWWTGCIGLVRRSKSASSTTFEPRPQREKGACILRPRFFLTLKNAVEL